MAPTFTRVVMPGAFGPGLDAFAKIEFSKGRLSIAGVIGPTLGGHARGSAGQWVMTLREYDERGHQQLSDLKLAPGWSAESARQFFDAWARWHLNDMRPNCEHQRGEAWDTQRKIELAYYGLTSEALRERDAAQMLAIHAAARGEVAGLNERGRALLGLTRWFAEVLTPPDADSPLSGSYEVKKRETKAAGWVNYSEHPSGLLCKPCEVCGYRYGSEWRREEVPAEVLAFLQALPLADKRPAWV